MDRIETRYMIDTLSVIDEAMGIETPKPPTVVETGVVINTESQEQRQEDHEFVRNKLRNMIEDTADGFADIIELAKQSESPRAFEVAAKMADTMASMSKNLMELHKETQKQAPAQQAQTINNVQQVFTGTNAELLKLIRNG